jgi:hypothetical protein
MLRFKNFCNSFQSIRIRMRRCKIPKTFRVSLLRVEYRYSPRERFTNINRETENSHHASRKESNSRGTLLQSIRRASQRLDRSTSLFMARYARQRTITKYSPAFVYLAERSPPSRHVSLRFRSSWKPQDIIDFYTYPCTLSGPPDVGACARVGADVGGRGSASPCARACVCVESGGAGRVSFTHRSSLGAREGRRVLPPSLFKASRLHRPSSERKTSIWRKRPMSHRLVRVPPD